MFRNRRTSQKPSDDFYKSFKANFPTVGQSLQSTGAESPSTTALADALDMPLNQQPTNNQQSDGKDADSTPRGSNEPWSFGTSGLTPSMMDTDNQNFNLFANQVTGYYTPTPGGTNTLYHSQAGDLHTPSFSMGLGTPLSMPTSESGLHVGHSGTTFNPFQPPLPQHYQPNQFQNVNPFQIHQQQGFPPQHFSNQPFDSLEATADDSPVDDLGMDLGPQDHHQSPDMLFRSQSVQSTNALFRHSQHPFAEKFRYHSTLNAPTAMVRHAEDIPITYLNKSQAYTLTVTDTQAPQSNTPARYRTFVRVSFEDEQQRQKPASCWQLWKEGRGTNEAHHRGGRLQAVEYVDASQTGAPQDLSKPRIDVESASFDGFCVVWSPPIGVTECQISVRFNFLSTDFSHSKGVKGIPVRLCAKTETLDEPYHSPNQTSGPEVCYCKVKLFRDHGAERKLSNDIAHVKKTIDKLKQQISQIESGLKDSGKRKRSGSLAKANLDSRPGKVPKHKRTWSMTSATSTGARGSAEEDLHMKLLTLQDMFTSTRPASVLYLRGEEDDDADAYPVKLSGEMIDLTRNDSGNTTGWEKQSRTDPPSSGASPTLSSKSLGGRPTFLQQPTPVAGASRMNSDEWQSESQMASAELHASLPEQLAMLQESQPTKIQTRSPKSGTLSGWIEAFGVDHSYQPPPERPIKPVACFYVQPRIAGKPQSDNFYRAIYVMSRTLKDFVGAIAMKCNLDPNIVVRTVRISREGLQILFDDECIRELSEGQDMTAEFCETHSENALKPEPQWDLSSADGPSDTENVSSMSYELKLLF